MRAYCRSEASSSSLHDRQEVPERAGLSADLIGLTARSWSGFVHQIARAGVRQGALPRCNSYKVLFISGFPCRCKFRWIPTEHQPQCSRAFAILAQPRDVWRGSGDSLWNGAWGPAQGLWGPFQHTLQAIKSDKETSIFSLLIIR